MGARLVTVTTWTNAVSVARCGRYELTHEPSYRRKMLTQHVSTSVSLLYVNCMWGCSQLNHRHERQLAAGAENSKPTREPSPLLVRCSYMNGPHVITNHRYECCSSRAV